LIWANNAKDGATLISGLQAPLSLSGTLFAPVLTDDSFWDFEKKGKKARNGTKSYKVILRLMFSHDHPNFKSAMPTLGHFQRVGWARSP